MSPESATTDARKDACMTLVEIFELCNKEIPMTLFKQLRQTNLVATACIPVVVVKYADPVSVPAGLFTMGRSVSPVTKGLTSAKPRTEKA